jgi:hypothetical protein
MRKRSSFAGFLLSVRRDAFWRMTDMRHPFWHATRIAETEFLRLWFHETAAMPAIFTAIALQAVVAVTDTTRPAG